MELFKDAGDNLIGECGCTWTGRFTDNTVAKPCRHLCAAWLLETPEGQEVAKRLYPQEGDAAPVHDSKASTVAPTTQPKLPAPAKDTTEEPTQLIVPRWVPKDTIVIWPSSVPMLEACPASRVIGDEDILIDTMGTPAKVGRAAHDMCEHLVKNGWRWPDDDDLFGWAMANGVPDEVDSLRFLGIFAAQAWHGNQSAEGIKKWFFEPNVEVTREFRFKQKHRYLKDKEVLIKIRGRNDLDEIFAEEERGVVLDWKSGWKSEETDYSGQMKAAGVLLAAADKRIKKVTMIIVWLRDRTMDIVTFTREELKAWLNDLVKYNAFWDGQTYGPGKHCLYCSKTAICPGRREVLHGVAESLMTAADDTELLVPIVDAEGQFIPDRAWAMYNHVRMVQQAAGQFLDEFKARIKEHGPMPIPAMPGKEIGILEMQGDLIIDPQLAWPVLRKYLQTDDVIAKCVSVGKGKLEDVIAAQTVKGEKGKAIAAVMADLDKAGALSRGQDKVQVRVVKTKTPVEV